MIERNFGQLKYLPVFCFLWLVATFIVSYSIATSLDHVYPLWPYISDTGTIPPESCIFGVMLNIGSLLMGLVLFVRYQQIKLILKTHDTHNKVINIMNLFCLVTGMLAAFGACIVANFQETSNMAVHLFGANLCFGVGSGYFIIHTAICFLIHRQRLAFNLIRVLLCIVYVISFAFTMIFAKLSFQEYNVSVQEAVLWDSDKPGYQYRLTSTISEWVLGICQGLYILSFAYDFRTMNYRLSFSLMQDGADEEISRPAYR